MHIFNLHADVLAVGWVVGQLADTVQPFIEGLTGSFVVKATYRLRPDDLPEPWPDEPLLVSGDKPTPDDRRTASTTRATSCPTSRVPTLP